jgi:hypothetical protein
MSERVFEDETSLNISDRTDSVDFCVIQGNLRNLRISVEVCSSGEVAFITAEEATTNRIGYGLLTEDEKKTLADWPHGLRCLANDRDNKWLDTKMYAYHHVVYRGKPAPIVTSTYTSVYANGETGVTLVSRVALLEGTKRIAVLRIDTVDGVSTAHLE